MEPNASLSFHFMNWLNEIEKERLKGERVGWFAFFFVVGYGRQQAANAPQQRRRANQTNQLTSLSLWME